MTQQNPWPPPPPQHQQPYQPGYYGYGDPGGADPLAPARRASVLMYVLGGLLLVGGLCCGTTSAMLPHAISANPEASSLFEQAGLPVEQMQMTLYVLTAASVLFALGLVILGAFVRKGGMGASVTAAVLVVLGLLGCGCLTLSTIINSGQLAAAGGSPMGAVGGTVCMLGLPTVLLVLLLMWLIQAIRNAPRVQGQLAHGPQGYWQYPPPQAPFPPYPQQDDRHGGYGAPAPPAPAPSPPPFPPQQPPQMPPPPDFGPPGKADETDERRE